MGKLEFSIVAPGERIINDILATIEVQEYAGVFYKFGNLIATNKRLIFHTQYPLIKTREKTVYQYEDIIWIDAIKSLFLFTNGVTFTVKLVNKGNARLFSEVVRVFADHASGISNCHPRSIPDT